MARVSATRKPVPAVHKAISAARQAALGILLALERGQGHSDDLLRGEAIAKLSAADRHLTTALVLGVLRWQIQLDQVLRGFLSKPNAKVDAEVLIALRLGAFQLLHLDRIPAHAAIDESVELTRQAGHRFASGMVNAVLRKVASSVDRSSTEESSTQAAAAHPGWIMDRWTSFFGPETACAICKHDQSPPTLAVRLAASEVERELTQAGVLLAPGSLLSDARIVSAGDVIATVSFQEGRLRIQDEGSQLIAEIAAASIQDGNTPKILDCCAAPGGKTLILAERHPAARIVACEASKSRWQDLHERLTTFGERMECLLADATQLQYGSEFDLVLADVPCSGTGTLSRNPEIRHRLRPEDLPRQSQRQRAILASALRAVRPGGRLIYSTCSLEPEENEQVIAAVLGENPSAGIVPLAGSLNTLRDRGILTTNAAERLQFGLTSEGFLRLTPGSFGTDGFFIAMIAKS